MPDFVEGFRRAIEEKDPERFLDLLADDVEMHLPVFATSMKGKETMRELARVAFEVMDDVKFETPYVVREGNRLAILAQVTVSFGKDYDMGPMHLPTAGKTVHAPGALFVTLDQDGRAKELTRVRDNWQIMRQLGLSSEDMERAYEQVREIVEMPAPAREGRQPGEA